MSYVIKRAKNTKFTMHPLQSRCKIDSRQGRCLQGKLWYGKQTSVAAESECFSLVADCGCHCTIRQMDNKPESRCLETQLPDND